MEIPAHLKEPKTLRQKQSLFALLIAKLMLRAYELGYELTCGDFWATTGHKANSRHYIRLAADLNLFKDGRYLTATNDHSTLGDYWESLHPLCRWGGRFKDGNHYELTSVPVKRT